MKKHQPYEQRRPRKDRHRKVYVTHSHDKRKLYHRRQLHRKSGQNRKQIDHNRRCHHHKHKIDTAQEKAHLRTLCDHHQMVQDKKPYRQCQRQHASRKKCPLKGSKVFRCRVTAVSADILHHRVIQRRRRRSDRKDRYTGHQPQHIQNDDMPRLCHKVDEIALNTEYLAFWFLFLSVLIPCRIIRTVIFILPFILVFLFHPLCILPDRVGCQIRNLVKRDHVFMLIDPL